MRSSILSGLERLQVCSNKGDKFPKAKQKPWLVRRLGNATARRRRDIQYRQTHRTALAKQQDEQATMSDDSHTVTTGLSTNVTTVATTFEEQPRDLPEFELPQAVNRLSVMTSATSFVSNFEEEANMGRRVPDLSNMILDGVQLEYGQPFECPYCRTIQMAAYRLEWKRHVFADLQPQIPLIIQACEVPLKYFDPSSCPLCDDWNPPLQVTDNAKQFYRHLARHLRQIALEALPLAIEGLEIVGTGSDSGDEDDSDTDTLPGAIQDRQRGVYCRKCEQYWKFEAPREKCPHCGGALEGSLRGDANLTISSDPPSPRELGSRHSPPLPNLPVPSQLRLKVNVDESAYFHLIVASGITYQSLIDLIDMKIALFTTDSLRGGILELRYRNQDGDFVSIGNDNDVQIAFVEMCGIWRRNPHTSDATIELSVGNLRKDETSKTAVAQTMPPLTSQAPPEPSSKLSTAAESSIIPSGNICVRALYDYDADDPTNLSFRAGDIIQVLSQQESGWWHGITNGVPGWFPSNYCHIVSCPEQTTETAQTEELKTNVHVGRRPRIGDPITVEDHWIAQATADGRLFYYNTVTGESSLELPLYGCRAVGG
ncbi:hypothetical protein DL771_000437 [Monosporascus sp. 5C6A]|nr:hypothetical protein DL771_000437 [Monosporascus sp. 5C6A]